MSQAQTDDSIKIITLHPSVGNSIDVHEKKMFYLFSDYKDSIFESAEILKYNDSTYTFRFKTTNGKILEKPTNKHELDEMYAKIDRIKPVEYVKTEHEKEARKRSSGNAKAEFGYNLANVLLEITLITLSVFIQSYH